MWDVSVAQASTRAGAATRPGPKRQPALTLGLLTPSVASVSAGRPHCVEAAIGRASISAIMSALFGPINEQTEEQLAFMGIRVYIEQTKNGKGVQGRGNRRSGCQYMRLVANRCTER